MTLHLRMGTTPGGVGLVEVWETRPDRTQELRWAFSPRRNSELLSLATFVSDDDLLVADREGVVSLHSLSRRKSVVERKLKLQWAGASLSPSRKSVFVRGVEQTAKEDHVLHQLDVPSLAIRHSFRSASKGVQSRLWALNDSEVLVHFIDYHGSPEGLDLVDLPRGVSTRHPFSNAPSSSFDPPPIAISAARGLGLRCDYGPIKTLTRDGALRYVAKVQVFEARSGRPLRSIPVREFRRENLGFYKNVDRLATALETPPESADYQDARDSFLHQIDGFSFCPDEDAFWVAFTYGSVRKISLDGSRKSAFLAHPGEAPDNRASSNRGIGCQAMEVDLGNPEWSLTIRCHAAPDALVRLSDVSGWSEEIPDSGERLLVLPASSLAARRKPETPRVSSSTPDALFVVSDLRDVRALRKALEDAIQKLSNGTTLRDGNVLRLAFQTPDGVVGEEAFFDAAQGSKSCLPLIERYVETLLGLPVKEPLWQDDENPAGAFAVRALVLSGKRHLPALLRYLKSPIVDIGHAVTYPAQLLHEAREKYGWCRETLRIVAAYTTTGEAVSHDYAKELARDEGFRNYLSKPKPRAEFDAFLHEEVQGGPGNIPDLLLELTGKAKPTRER